MKTACIASDSHARTSPHRATEPVPPPPGQALAELRDTLLEKKVPHATATNNTTLMVHAFQPKFGAESVAPPPQYQQHFSRKVEGGTAPWFKLGNAAMAAEPSSEPSEFSPLMPSSPASFDLARHASPSSKNHKASTHATTTTPIPGCCVQPLANHMHRTPTNRR